MNLSVPTPLQYWKRPWAKAHIYTECPQFIKEWAGWNFHRPRIANSVRQASRHTTGLCPLCWFVYQRQMMQGRPEVQRAVVEAAIQRQQEAEASADS